MALQEGGEDIEIHQDVPDRDQDVMPSALIRLLTAFPPEVRPRLNGNREQWREKPEARPRDEHGGAQPPGSLAALHEAVVVGEVQKRGAELGTPYKAP